MGTAQIQMLSRKDKSSVSLLCCSCTGKGGPKNIKQDLNNVKPSEYILSFADTGSAAQFNTTTNKTNQIFELDFSQAQDNFENVPQNNKKVEQKEEIQDNYYSNKAPIQLETAQQQANQQYMKLNMKHNIFANEVQLSDYEDENYYPVTVYSTQQDWQKQQSQQKKDKDAHYKYSFREPSQKEDETPKQYFNQNRIISKTIQISNRDSSSGSDAFPRLIKSMQISRDDAQCDQQGGTSELNQSTQEVEWAASSNYTSYENSNLQTLGSPKPDLQFDEKYLMQNRELAKQRRKLQKTSSDILNIKKPNSISSV